MKISTNSYGDVWFWSYPIQLPLNEVLEWKTSYFESRKGKTQSAKMREFPRQMFKVITHSSESHRREFRNILIPNQDKLWALPDWREVSRVNLNAGATSFVVDYTANGFFPPSGLAVLWKSFSNWEIIEYTFNGVSLVFPPLQNTWKNAILMPVRIGHIVEVPKIQQTETYVKVEFRFQALVNDTDMLIDTDAPSRLNLTFFNNVDLFEECPLYKGQTGVRDEIRFPNDRFDPMTGEFYVNYLWDCPKQKRDLYYSKEGRVELLKFYSWLYRRSGRYRSFYMPTWTRDLELDHSGTLFICFNIVPTVLDPCHDEIAFRTTDGKWRIRNIVGSRSVGGQLEIRIDVPLNVEAVDVERISYLRQYVLERDRIEIVHNGAFSFEANIPIVENDEVRLPNIRTTNVYPAIGVSSMSVTPTIPFHSLKQITARANDQFTYSFEPLLLELPIVVDYIEYSIQPEEITNSFEPLLLELPVVAAYHEYDIGEEEISLNFEVISLSLVVVANYITYDRKPPDEIGLSFEVVEISLYV